MNARLPTVISGWRAGVRKSVAVASEILSTPRTPPTPVVVTFPMVSPTLLRVLPRALPTELRIWGSGERSWRLVPPPVMAVKRAVVE